MQNGRSSHEDRGPYAVGSGLQQRSLAALRSQKAGRQPPYAALGGDEGSLPVPAAMAKGWYVCSVAQSCVTLRGPMDLKAARLLCPWGSPSKNTGVGCHALLQGIFPTQGSNPSVLCLLHWQVGSLLVPGKPQGWYKNDNRVFEKSEVQSLVSESDEKLPWILAVS